MSFHFPLPFGRAFVCLAFFSFAVAAEETPETLVITATRFSETALGKTGDVSAMTQETLAKTPATNLPDIIATQSGLFLTQTGAGALGINASLDIRGFGATAGSNTLILLDGVRLNPVDGSNILWSSLPKESIERVEIWKGSGSVLYGDKASGGVVHVITKKNEKPVATVLAGIGNDAYRVGEAHLANRGERGSFQLFAHGATTDGARQNADQKESALTGRGAIFFDKGEIATQFSLYQDDYGMPGSLPSAAYEAGDVKRTRNLHDRSTRSGYRLSPVLSFTPNEAVTFELQTAQERQQQTAQFFGQGWQSASDAIYETQALMPKMLWQHALLGSPSETVLGADYYVGKVDADNQGYADFVADQKSLAFYTQNTTQLADALEASIGFRTHKMRQAAKQAADAWNPEVAGETTYRQNAWHLSLAYVKPAFSLYAKTGTSFRFPNLNELFGLHPVTNQLVFSGDIKPQTARMYEVGGTIKHERASLKAALYRMNLHNEIGYDGASNTNFPRTQREGLEVEGQIALTRSWTGALSYTYARARFSEGANIGRDLPLVPRQKASLLLSYTLGRAGDYSLLTHYVGPQRFDADFQNTQGFLKARTSFDLQGTWKLDAWQVTAKVMNLSDRKYANYAVYSPGGWGTAADTYYYPADGRRFFVTAQYRF